MILDRLERIVDIHDIVTKRLDYLKALVRLDCSYSSFVKANGLIALIGHNIDDIVEAILE